jgi:hypothetical protein
VRAAQDWFVEQTGDHPCDSEVKKRVRKLFAALPAPIPMPVG